MDFSFEWDEATARSNAQNIQERLKKPSLFLAIRCC